MKNTASNPLTRGVRLGQQAVDYDIQAEEIFKNIANKRFNCLGIK